VEVHSLTLSHTPGNMKCDSRTSLLAHTFANPCLGCEPKVRVATKSDIWMLFSCKGTKYTIGRGVVPPPKGYGCVKLMFEVVPTKFTTPLPFNLH